MYITNVIFASASFSVELQFFPKMYVCVLSYVQYLIILDKSKARFNWKDKSPSKHIQIHWNNKHVLQE